MTLAKFSWTDRVYPIVELGIGDTRIPVGSARWDTAKWDASPGSTWVGTEPSWYDITCDTYSYRCEYGRPRIIDRFVAGAATVLVNNSTGWADPNTVLDPNILTVRPGRAIRIGVVHAVYGVRWLFRGFVDAVIPVYDPTQTDTVQLDCIDALGEVSRAKLAPLPVAVAGGETVTARIARLLDLGKWPTVKRDLTPTGETLIADKFDGQLADLLTQAADSGGGSVFGDYEANIVYMPRDWQTFTPGTPPDGTIGNVAAGDVCPTRWERPFNRSDIATRVLMGRKDDDASIVVVDDVAGQQMYGIEPFERTDLLCESSALLTLLANRVLQTRAASTSPRVRSVSLAARTSDNALDLMTTVDVYTPSRYRCRLQYPRGLVFDDEYFATAVVHEITPTGWTLELNLDSAAPFAVAAGGWDSARWDLSTWANPVLADQPGNEAA